MEGASSERVPVISLTMRMTAIGTRPTPANSAIIPTITRGPGTGIIPGATEFSTTQNAAPTNPPTTSEGAKTPALPPEPTVREVAMILNSITSSRTARIGSVKNLVPMDDRLPSIRYCRKP